MAQTEEQPLSAARRHIIERPRLTRLLDETTARVIMLVAPAGYGKTTLAHQWLADRPHVWYGPTAASVDVTALGLGITQAAEEFMSVGQRFREWLHTRRGSEDPDLAADLLAEDLWPWPGGAWLTIDDYHCLTPGAEQVIQRLRGIDCLHLFLTTRRRPAWRSAREVLYGEVLELEANMLAMSGAEADEVLSAFDDATAQGLIALARGWPAIIGLASFADQSPRLDEDALPPTLHAYIADELYASVHPSVRQELAQLSLMLSPSIAQAQALLGDKSDLVLAEGLRVGFLTHHGAGLFSIHPLLRSFLRLKLADVPSHRLDPLVAQVVEALIAEREWENAFQVIQDFSASDLLAKLIGASLYELLDQGLLSTLSKFVAFGRSRRDSSPLLDLAEAELSFREGLHERSKGLAEAAGKRLRSFPSFASKAFCRAGHSAYFCDDPDLAAANFREARELAKDLSDEQAAIWGLFLCAVEREDEVARIFLNEFEEACSAEHDDLLRLQNGRLHFGMRLGTVKEGLSGAEAVASVVSKARDPVVRISFWHVYAGALRVSADYSAALEASDRALHEITKFDVAFARAHVYLARAGAYAGLGAYAEALSLLAEAARIGSRNGDTYLQMSERTLRCRVQLLLGDVEQAASAMDASWPQVAPSGQYAEFLACRALVLGTSAPTHEDPLEVLSQADRMSRENEASCLCTCVRALLTRGTADVPGTVASGFRRAVRGGILDPLVFALRFDRRLARRLTRDPVLRRTIHQIMSMFDGSGADALPVCAERRPLGEADGLTPREQQVLALLAEGKSNKEIAGILVLTVPTVKVHVRHILAKLGVRTRTEAAIHTVTRQQRAGAARPLQADGPEQPG